MRKVVGIEMESDIHDALKIKAVQEKVTIKSLVEKIITKYLTNIRK